MPYLEVFNKYAALNGRASRREYWSFMIIHIIIIILLEVASRYTESPIVQSIATVYIIITFFPTVALHIRRVQDVGLSWYYGVIPLISLLVCIFPSYEGPNSHGEEPLD